MIEDGRPSPELGLLWQVPDYSQMQRRQSFGAEAPETTNSATPFNSNSVTNMPLPEMVDGHILADVEEVSSSDWADPSLPGEPSHVLPAMDSSTLASSDSAGPLVEPTIAHDVLGVGPSGMDPTAGGFPTANHLLPHPAPSFGSSFSMGLEPYPSFTTHPPAPNVFDPSSYMMSSTPTFSNHLPGLETIHYQANQQSFLPYSQLDTGMLYDERVAGRIHNGEAPGGS